MEGGGVSGGGGGLRWAVLLTGGPLAPGPRAGGLAGGPAGAKDGGYFFIR